MSELISTARLLHRVLILAAAAIITMAIAPRDTERYSTALPELLGITTLFGSELHLALAGFAEAHQLVPSGDVILRYGLEADTSGPNPALVPVISVHPLAPQASIQQLRSFLIAPPWTVEVPDSVGLLNALESLHSDCSCELLLRSGHRDALGTWRLEVESTTNRLDTLAVFGSDSLPLPPAATLGRLWLDWAVDSAAAVGSAWANADDTDPLLVDRSQGNGGIFPRLQPIWSEVRDLIPVEALAVARERLSAQENRLQLLGLSMSERVALIIAFPGIFFVLLFLLANLLTLERYDRTKLHEALAEHPIVLFQQNGVARLLSASSIVLLPSGSVIILWIRTVAGPQEPTWQFVLYMCGTLLVFIASVQVFRRADGLRRVGELPPS